MERNFFATVTVVVAALSLCPSVLSTGYEHAFCSDLKPQNTLDMDHLMGMWYGVEIVNHLREDEGTSYSDVCPTIHISDISDEGYTRNRYSDSNSYYYGMTTSYPHGHVRPGDHGYDWSRRGQGGIDYTDEEYRYIRVYWDEYGNSNEYILRFTNSKRGFWMLSTRPNNGVRVSGYSTQQYEQFSGTIQVMKAVQDHLVLTFCFRLPETQLFSVIMARDPHQMSRQVVHSIHNLLSRRDLSTTSIRRSCNGSSNLTVSATVLALAAFFVYFRTNKIPIL